MNILKAIRGLFGDKVADIKHSVRSCTSCGSPLTSNSMGTFCSNQTCPLRQPEGDIGA